MNYAPFASILIAVLISVVCLAGIVFTLTRIRKLMETSKRRKAHVFYEHEPDFGAPHAGAKTIVVENVPEPTDQESNRPMEFLRRSTRSEDFPHNKTGG